MGRVFVYEQTKQQAEEERQRAEWLTTYVRSPDIDPGTLMQR